MRSGERSELGINYFDTAQMYGNGESERNLGRVLKSLKPDVYVGTKVRLPPTEPGKIGAAIAASLEGSLARLQMDSVDLFQFHNAVVGTTEGANFASATVLEEVVPAFELLRAQGKLRFFGITANGETAALHRVVDARALDTGQVSYNLLNPSPGGAVPAGYPAQDYGNLLGHMQAAEMGVINIRVLAAGALSGTEERHPLGSPPPAPIGSGADYRRDVERARRFEPLVRSCRQPDRGRAALRHRAARSVDCAGRLLDVGAARIRGAFDRKGAALAGRARPGSRHPAWFCRRAAVIRLALLPGSGRI